MLWEWLCCQFDFDSRNFFFRQITLGLFSQIHDFLNHCYIFTRKYIFLFYFKHSLDTVNSLSRSNFLVLLLFKPWLSSSCTSSIENYILRLLEAALGRRALGRRRQGSEAVFRLLYRESQQTASRGWRDWRALRSIPRLAAYFTWVAPTWWLVYSAGVVHTGYVVQCCCQSQLPPFLLLVCMLYCSAALWSEIVQKLCWVFLLF